jgi:hypothetical protein
MNPGPGEVVVYALIAVAVWFLISLILREFMCWYWKINQALRLLESIDESLKQLPTVSRSRTIS